MTKLCDICKTNPAKITLQHTVNGVSEVLNLCEACASKMKNKNTPPENWAEAIFKLLKETLKNVDIAAGNKPENKEPNISREDRYTETFKKVLSLAKEEARKLHSPLIGTEFLLYGLMAVGEGISYELMTQYGVTAEGIEELIQKYLKSNVMLQSDAEVAGYTPAALLLLREAENCAKEVKSIQVSTEHLLEAILHHPESPAFRLLLSMDINMESLYHDVKLAENGSRIFVNKDAKEKQKSALKKARSMTPTLDKYSRDLTAMAEEGTLDPVVGREKEIERVIQILSRRTKNNPCLIGEPGVGKTAVVEGLALRIAAGEVPDMVQNIRIYSLDLSGMVAGTKYRGEFEERIKAVLEEVRRDKSIVLFLDEIHTIIGAGSAEGSLDAANIIKPALSRGELQLIGATTISEYRKHIEKDAALERRFQPVQVDEPSIEESLEILRGLRPSYEDHHKVEITDEAISSAVTLSARFLNDRFLPDKAIDLIDEASSRVRLSTYQKPKNLKKAEDELEKVRSEREDAVISSDFEKAALLKKDELRLEKRIKKEKDKLSEKDGEKRPLVTREDIASVVSTWTKILVQSITESEATRLKNLSSILEKRVVGQKEAVDQVSKAIRRGRVGLKDPKRPIGSFLFLGPTGVGKTELTKALSEAVFGSEQAMIRVDMSEYMEKHSVSKLIGSPPGYVGFDDGGQLSEKVRRNPYSVLLFDEVEKAHPDVFNILLQVLDDGRITDSQGRIVDFKNTVIILTSNIGAEGILTPKNLGFNHATSEKEDYDRMKNKVMEEVKKSFKPEFLNRLDEILVFHSLNKDSMKEIVSILLSDLKKRVKDSMNITLSFGETAENFLLEKGYDPKYGARPLKRAIQTWVEDPLSELVLDNKFVAGDFVTVQKSGTALTFKKKEKKQHAEK